MRLVSLVTTLALAGAAVGVGAPASGAAVPPTAVAAAPIAPAAATATLSGRVRDANGKPVVGVIVEVFTPRGEFVNDSRTSFAGTFSIPGIALGSYKVRARPPSTRPWATMWAPSAATFATAGTVYVRSIGGRATITLPRGGVLAGRVTGLPAQATVRACEVSFLDCRTVIMRRGAFRIPNLPAGTYGVVVRLVTGRSLVFPAQPPRPGVPVRTGRTTTIALNAVTQAAPVIVSQ